MLTSIIGILKRLKGNASMLIKTKFKDQERKERSIWYFSGQSNLKSWDGQTAVFLIFKPHKAAYKTKAWQNRSPEIIKQ